MERKAHSVRRSAAVMLSVSIVRRARVRVRVRVRRKPIALLRVYIITDDRLIRN